MALSQSFYMVMKQAARQGLLPQRGAILEFGEANWYGDMPLEVLMSDIEQIVAEPQRRNTIIAAVQDAAQGAHKHRLFHLAKAVYGALFDPTRMDAIDFNGTPTALKLDLNEPIELERQYDVTINNGTAEHIFNVGQFFKTMHASTKPGGLMFHDAPFTGWIDHGFYTLQPTLFLDMAAANGYEVLGMFYFDWRAKVLEKVTGRDAITALVQKHKAAKNTNLITVLRKGAIETPFVSPFQGYYAGTLTPEQAKVWQEER